MSASPLRICCRLGLACLPLALTACLNLAPPVRTPALPVVDRWPADIPEQTAEALTDLSWSHYFRDPDLCHLIGLALAHNRDLRLAALNVREAEAAYRIRQSDTLPTMGLQLQDKRSLVPGDLNPAGQPMIQSSHQLAFGLTNWEIDLWGRIRNLKDAALDDWLATDAARQGLQVLLVRQVADAVLVLRELDERLALAREAVRNRQQSFDLYRQRQAVGASSALELTQVRTLLIQAQALQAGLEQEQAAARHALTLLLGTDPGLPPAHASRLEATGLSRLAPGLPSEVLLARPDIRAAEYRLQAAHARIGAARAAFLPRIALTSGIGTASAALSGLFAGGSQAWTFAPVIELPIFTAGRLQSELDVATVRRDQAIAAYEKDIQTAFREVSDALSAREILASRIDIQSRMVSTQEERARLAQLRHDSGAAPYLEVLDARRDLLTAQQQLVELRRAWLSSQVALYAALGGGADPQAADPGRPASGAISCPNPAPPDHDTD